jgi:beta-glucosidase
VDDAVRRILRVKFQLGLFDQPEPSPKLETIGSAEHRAVARECVRQSLVLLKNDNSALPLSKTIKRLHVAGKAANDVGMQCGGWTIDWQGRTGAVTTGGTTILEAIRQTVGKDTRVTFSSDPKEAAGADAVLVVVGETPYAEMKGDRADLSLSAADAALIRDMRKTGTRVVTLLISGRPLILGPSLEASDALVAAWLPGTEGKGVADVLFGEFAPTGKLPCPWPASMDQVGPLSQGKGDVKPLFAYGFGLSYGAAPRQSAKAGN